MPTTPDDTSTSWIHVERLIRLQERLRRLYSNYDSEIRVEEKMRLEIIISEAEQELAQLEALSAATTSALKPTLTLSRQARIREFRGKLQWEGDLDAQRQDL